uniref:Uncharacterized protein n=1 Tax=Oryza sativa subsp. japonica TaxID=39947 RepID=Q5KQC1_ORYSJ|nr:hypothetical protein [Oryza sativa Japonica Group]
MGLVSVGGPPLHRVGNGTGRRWSGGKRHLPPSPQGTRRVSGAPQHPAGPVDGELNDNNEDSELDSSTATRTTSWKMTRRAAAARRWLLPPLLGNDRRTNDKEQ